MINVSRSRPMDAQPAKGKVAELLLSLLLTVFFAVAAANPAVGQVQLPTVNLGDTNFEDGVGAPGWLLEEFPSGYIADELKDSKGKTVPGSSRVTTYSTTSHVVFASRKQFLRGWMAGEVLLPLVDVDVQLANGTESRVRGLADLTVGAGLQWAPKKIGHGVFAQRAMIDVGVPTGTNRGSVRLASNNFQDAAVIDGNYLGTEHDFEAIVRAIEAARELGNQRAFDRLRENELIPGPKASAEEIRELARLGSASFGYGVGTCKIGVDELGPELRVHGILGLRVADASVMPRIITGPGTNASAHMIAGRAAELILG